MGDENIEVGQPKASNKKGDNILIGVTGSVAAIKIPLIISQLKEKIPGAAIKLITTQHATHFFSPEDILREHPDVKIFKDEDEWTSWKKMTDDVLHIELRRWADLMLIAPLDANTLAKIAGGLCDNLLTCVVRAWDVKQTKSKPLLFAPAMNTMMWEHPATEEHTSKLVNFLTFKMIPPVVKKLACGDYGIGAMASPEEIVNEVIRSLSTSRRSDSESYVCYDVID